MAVSALVLHEMYNKHKERVSISRLSSLFFVKVGTLASSSSSVDVMEVNNSLMKSETSISILANSVNKCNVSEFLSLK